MTKSELVVEVAERAHLTLKECDRILHAFTTTIEDCLAAGEKVTISGFGTFERRRRRATVARNPQTLKRIHIAEQYVAGFRAGTSLREAVKKR